jgi:hypothetical protein
MIIGLFLSLPLTTVTDAGNTFIILNSYSLLSALFVGLVTSFLVLSIARKMKGGTLGTALGFMSAGMFVIVTGYLINNIGSFMMLDQNYQIITGTIHDIFFIGGLILIAIAAQRISKAISGI